MKINVQRKDKIILKEKLYNNKIKSDILKLIITHKKIKINTLAFSKVGFKSL